MEIEVKAGNDTEDLLAFITSNLSDDELDAIDIKRQFEEVEGLATEPVTIVAVITASGALLVTVSTLVAKWLESRRQREAIELLIRGYRESPEAGAAVLQLTSQHAGVKVTAHDMKG